MTTKVTIIVEDSETGKKTTFRARNAKNVEYGARAKNWLKRQDYNPDTFLKEDFSDDELVFSFTTQKDEYGDRYVVREHDVDGYGVIAVVADSKEEGHIYAELIGLDHYVVVTIKEQMNDLKIRAVVISPKYIEKINNKYMEAANLLFNLHSSTTNFMSRMNWRANNGE